MHVRSSWAPPSCNSAPPLSAEQPSRAVRPGVWGLQQMPPSRLGATSLVGEKPERQCCKFRAQAWSPSKFRLLTDGLRRPQVTEGVRAGR